MSQQEVGAAYVTLLPSASGFSKQVEKELSGSFDAAERHGAQKFSGLFADVAKWGAAAITTIGVSLAGLALKGGISRALNIEDATAKLRGLGHDAQAVQAIMTDALAAVRGTAFGLDTAAKVAATAVAAGIEPGKELERYLRLTADAATIAGVSMEEIGAILNKTTTANRVFTDELNQLAERGLPIFQWLQDKYGVTAEELRKMVAAGKVDAETFRKVIEENIGGAALASGDTVRGAWANTMAALSRLGAAAVTPMLGFFKSALDAIMPLIDAVTARLQPVVEQVADRLAPAFERFFASLQGGIDLSQFEPVASAFSSISGALAPLITMLAGGGLSALSGLLGPFASMLPTITPLLSGVVGLLVAMFQHSEALRGVVGSVFSALGDVVMALLPALAPLGTAFSALAKILGDTLAGVLSTVVVPVLQMLAQQVLPALAPALAAITNGLLPVFASVLGHVAPLLGKIAQALLPALVTIFDAAAPIIATVASILGSVLADAVGFLAPLLEGLAPILAEVVSMLGDILAQALVAVSPLLGMVGDLLRALMPPLQLLIPPILSIVEAFMPLIGVIGDLIGALLPPLVSLLTALLEPIMAVIEPLIGALAPILELIAGLIGQVLVPVIEWLADVLGTVLGAVVEWIAMAIRDYVVPAFKELISWISKAAEWVRGFFQDAIAWVKDFASWYSRKIAEVIGFFADMPRKIKEFFVNARDWLLDAGGRIIQGLIDGIRSGFDRVKGVLQELTGRLPDWKGPAVVDRALLVKPAQLVMDGFIEGLESRFADVRATLGDFTGDLAASVSVSGQVVGEGPDVLTRDDLADFARELADRLAVASARIAEGRLDLAGEQLRALSYQGGEVTI